MLHLVSSNDYILHNCGPFVKTKKLILVQILLTSYILYLDFTSFSLMSFFWYASNPGYNTFRIALS